MVRNDTYRLYCKRQGKKDGRDYCVTVRDGKLCLALPNNRDPSQLWKKDESSKLWIFFFCLREKCGFMLVHVATDKAVKYGGNGDELILVNKPNCPDKSVLWVESGDINSGYKYIKTKANLGMVMDAWTGYIDDGTKVSIYPENNIVIGQQQQNADNQLWKLILTCK